MTHLSSIKEALHILYGDRVVGDVAGTEAELGNGVSMAVLGLLNVAHSQGLRLFAHALHVSAWMYNINDADTGHSSASSGTFSDILTPSTAHKCVGMQGGTLLRSGNVTSADLHLAAENNFISSVQQFCSCHTGPD